MWYLPRRFLQLHPADRVITFEALVMLLSSHLLVKLFPYRLSERILTAPLSRGGSRERVTTVLRVSRGIGRVKRHLPLRVTCLMETVAASLMLGRRGIPSSAFIGVRTGEGGGLDAHAWLQAEGVTVAGGGGDGFRVIARYERGGR